MALRPGTMPSLRITGVLGILLLWGLLFVPSTASAAGVHIFSDSLGSSGSGDGQLELATNSGLAVNESTHDVFVADTGNSRVVQFSAGGDFIRAFSAGSFITPAFIAIDNSGGASDGDVYVADTGNNSVTKFEANGTLVPTWGTGGQLTGNGSESFTSIVGIAVGSSGNLSVMWGIAPPGKIFNFTEAGAFIGPVIETPRGSSQRGLGVDQAGNFFKVNGVGFESVHKFPPTGLPDGGQQITADNTSTGFGVDPASGELYVSRGGSVVDHYEFNGTGEVIQSNGSSCLPGGFSGCQPTVSFGSGNLSAAAGLAVDGTNQTVYAADSGTDEVVAFTLVAVPMVATLPATDVGTESATLNGTVNSSGEALTECAFEYDTLEYEEGEGPHGTSVPCEDPNAAEVGEGAVPVAVHADISNLTPGTEYHFRLVAANANGPGIGEDEQFLTPGPSVSGTMASQVTPTSAKITGQVNPRGNATDVVVQYVTDAKFQLTEFDEAVSVPAVPAELGAGNASEEVTQLLTGLTPSTTYHLRIVASNVVATTEGADGEFTTFAPGEVALPDGRAYELVSPPQKAGEVLPPEPDAALGLGGSCNECLPGANNQIMPMQVAPDGESVLYEGQPFTAGLSAGPNEYISDRGPAGWGTESLSPPVFNSGSGQGYLAFSSDLSRGVVYQVEPALSPEAPTRGGKSFANLYLREEDGTLRALVSEEPPNRDPSFPTQGENQFRIVYAGANAGASFEPAFTHLLFEANDALTEAVPDVAPEAPEVEAGQGCSFTEQNCNLYEWEEGELRLINVLPENEEAAGKAMIGSGRLLAKLAPEAEAPNVDHAISDDGSRVFWTSEETGQLYVRVNGEETLEVPGPASCKASVAPSARVCFLAAAADGSSVLLSDGQVYELDEEGEEYEPTSDLSEGEGGFAGILGASEDLSRVYFVDTEALNGEGEEGEPNLYAWDEGTRHFIGVLRAGDNEFAFLGRYGTWKAARPNRTAQVSPDGEFLALMSQASLTGYDNRLSGGSFRAFEVFVYAAESETLHCASCNPSGQRPVGKSNLSLIRPGTVVAPTFPPFPQPGNLSKEGDGRLFFESQDTLSPQDVNGSIQDVYQWEPNGVGSCKQANGCVSLISSGRSPNDSMFVDSTPSGDDAFFITREKLLPPDKNDQLDLYDARVGGGFPETGTEPCSGEMCKGPIASPPVQPTSASNTFSGSGNPPRSKPCKKGFVKKQGKCVKKKPKKKKARHNRGGGR